MITHLILWAALAVAAPVAPNPVPPAVAEFHGEHETLLGVFSSFLARAMRPTATQTDRANLILFLRADVLPHAAAEEAVLYPAVERALLTHGHATATMIMDHRAVARLLDEMAGLTAAANPTAYNRKACQLETILRTHFAKEQDFVVPALQQRLSPAELDAVFASMRAFARH